MTYLKTLSLAQKNFQFYFRYSLVESWKAGGEVPWGAFNSILDILYPYHTPKNKMRLYAFNSILDILNGVTPSDVYELRENFQFYFRYSVT